MEVALYDCKLETLSNDEDSLSVSIYEPDDVKDVNTIIVVLNGSGLQFFSSLNNYKEPYTLATDLCNYGTHKFPYTCKIYKSNPRFWTKDLLESSRFSRYIYMYHALPANTEWGIGGGGVSGLALGERGLYSSNPKLQQNGIDFTNVDGIFGGHKSGSYKYIHITGTTCYYTQLEQNDKEPYKTINDFDPSNYGSTLVRLDTVYPGTEKPSPNYYVGGHSWTSVSTTPDQIVNGVVSEHTDAFMAIMSNGEPCNHKNTYEWHDIPNSGDPSKYDFVGIKVFDYDYWNAHRSERHLFTPWEYLIYSEYDYYDINSPSSNIMIKIFTQKSTFEYTEYDYIESKKLMKFYNGSYKPIIDPNGSIKDEDGYIRSYSVPIVCSGKLDPNNSYSTTLYVNDMPYSQYEHEKTMTFLFSSNIELFKEE